LHSEPFAYLHSLVIFGVLARQRGVAWLFFIANKRTKPITKTALKKGKKMAKKSAEPALLLVFGVLEDNPGQFLTAREILSKVYEKHSISLDPFTIRDALQVLIQLKKPIEQAEHKLYAHRIPTAVFKFQKPT
jgi:hypothetical protein